MSGSATAAASAAPSVGKKGGQDARPRRKRKLRSRLPRFDSAMERHPEGPCNGVAGGTDHPDVEEAHNASSPAATAAVSDSVQALDAAEAIKQLKAENAELHSKNNQLRDKNGRLFHENSKLRGKNEGLSNELEQAKEREAAAVARANRLQEQLDMYNQQPFKADDASVSHTLSSSTTMPLGQLSSAGGAVTWQAPMPLADETTGPAGANATNSAQPCTQAADAVTTATAEAEAVTTAVEGTHAAHVPQTAGIAQWPRSIIRGVVEVARITKEVLAMAVRAPLPGSFTTNAPKPAKLDAILPQDSAPGGWALKVAEDIGRTSPTRDVKQMDLHAVGMPPIQPPLLQQDGRLRLQADGNDLGFHVAAHIPFINRNQLLENAELGKGGQGVVKDASMPQYNEHGQLLGYVSIAAKFAKTKCRGALASELYIAQHLNHPNCLQPLAAITAADNPSELEGLVFEKMFGDVPAYMRMMGPDFAHVHRVVILLAVIEAVIYIHKLDILHQDIKAENILVDLAADGRSLKTVKLADWGVVGQMNHRNPGIGTYAFLAPENLKYTVIRDGDGHLICCVNGRPVHMTEQPITAQSDMYAMGALMIQLLTGRPPWDLPDIEMEHYKSRGLLKLPVLPPCDPTSLSSVQYYTLMEQCLLDEPSDRPTPEEFLVRVQEMLAQDEFEQQQQLMWFTPEQLQAAQLELEEQQEEQFIMAL